MGDTTVRVLIVLGAGLAVAIFALVLQGLRSRPTRVIANTGLTPGTYLFTSATCQECSNARSALEDFVEISWEERPDVFSRLEVTKVPSTLVVDSAGSGTWRAWSPTARSP